jgi:photosystem II stability/assembly factor-like uncharacterized protein
MYRAAALDPSDPDVAYFGSTHKGMFKTFDGGRTWHQMNAGLTATSASESTDPSKCCVVPAGSQYPCVNELTVDPSDHQTVYAATDGGAFVSIDGGEHWSLVQEGLGPNPVVYSIAVDPNDSSRVYAATPDGVFRLAGAPPQAAAAPTPSPGSP